MRPGIACTAFATAVALMLPVPALLAAEAIHVTYLWHMHQPIYYPYENVRDTDGAGRYNFNVESVHNERVGNYTTWPKDAVQQGADKGMLHAGAQCSFSGSLGENLNHLWGYCTGATWDDSYDWARNGILTTRGNPRLDMVGIAYHHSLMPLTCRESMKMQIRLHRELYTELWDCTSYSKGFWPPEVAFAEWIIPALLDEGIEWVLVDNIHFDRACENYPWNSGGNLLRPNPADVQNPDPGQWVQLNNVWAPTKVSAPWGYQPHYVQYVDPWSDPTSVEVRKIVAVPAARYEGNENGRGGYGSFKPQNVWTEHIGYNTNVAYPMLMVCHSDGDNYGMKNSDAWHAQHGYFLDMCQANTDFENTTVQDYLEMFPPAASDVIHVEPGSWSGADNGDPEFKKWCGDPQEDGKCPDRFSWSVLVAAQNRVLHADSLESNYTMDDVQWGINSDAARAWHFYLNGETSCYWYWDTDWSNPWNGNVTRACNMAVAEANKVLARHPGTDTVGPSIFTPQREPYNPGGYEWNETEPQPSDFEVWTFVDDVSGLAGVTLHWRTDKDGFNPVSSYQNELYATGSEVNAWNALPMTGSWDPSDKGPGNIVPDPACRAMTYKATVSGQSDVLIDYFVESADTYGNTNRSDIMHVYVGQRSGGTPVTFSPGAPRDCEDLVTTYNPLGRVLSNASPVYLNITFDNWTTATNYLMYVLGSGSWVRTNEIPENATAAAVYLNDTNSVGAGTIDNNGGANWSVAISSCAGTGAPSSVIFNPAGPTGCDDVQIMYYPNGGPLKDAPAVSIHVGRNGWQNIPPSDPAMSWSGSNWTYSYSPPAGTYEINCCFNNGSNIWDSNGGQDWSVAVSGCSATNPAVYFSPDAPWDYEDLVTTYDPSNRPLQGVSPIVLTITFDEWTSYTNYTMAQKPDGTWVFTNDIPGGAPSATVNFRNAGETILDDDNGANWSVTVRNGGGSNSTVSLAPGTPVISADPDPDQNQADDAFDLVTSGGAATTKDQGGFGGFGSVCLNYDDTNFYVGATGCGLSGDDHNAMVVFLGFSTLSHDATNLWNLGGLPNGLDLMHNVRFEWPMDIAVVLGDEYGDGTFPNFNLGGGYDFGQGVFVLSSSGVFSQVDGARLSQFDGSGTNVTGSGDADSDRLTERWECSIPWSGLQAAGVTSLTHCYLAGVVASDYAGGPYANDRYISGNYLGDSATGVHTDQNNYAMDTITITPIDVGLPDADMDGDGLPDEWENQYFGGPTNADCGEDVDLDGFTNCEEYELGTHPKSPSSAFVLNQLVQPTGFPQVTWRSVGGKEYALDYSDHLPAGFITNIYQVTEDDVADGVASTEAFTDNFTLTGGPPTNGFRSYRVRLVPRQ